ncbi:MAG: hypothetical protein AAF541_12070 [Pseudomonadota bacterium]
MTRRVHIIGPAGSGKITLAQAFAAAHSAHQELDHIYYTDVPRRTKRLNQDGEDV